MIRTLLVALIANGAALAANPVKDAVPLFFIANHGQAPSAVRFMAKGSGLTAYFSPGGALFRVDGGIGGARQFSDDRRDRTVDDPGGWAGTARAGALDLPGTERRASGG